MKYFKSLFIIHNYNVFNFKNYNKHAFVCASHGLIHYNLNEKTT